MEEISLEEIAVAADRFGYVILPREQFQQTNEAIERAAKALNGSLQRVEEVFDVVTELNLLLQSEDSPAALLAKEIISRHFPSDQ